MEILTCRVCKSEKPDEEFYLHSKGTGYDRICRSCKVIRVRKYRKDIKRRAVEYKGGKCIKCGYNRSIVALDFNHIDPTKKDFELGGKRPSWKNTIIELDKCMLICKNCHAELHELLYDGKSTRPSAGKKRLK